MFQRFIILSVLLKIITCVWTRGTCGEDGSVRLVDGAHANEGRLEVCISGQWGTVCNDGPTVDDGFDIDAARVVCRQLGLSEDDVITNISFGEGSSSRPVHLDDVQCNGTESTLLDCTHSATVDSGCRSHSEDIGIICQRSQDCRDGSVRLVDGDNYNAAAGRVEYCVGGRWGTVCNYEWTVPDATVVCRQLGLPSIDPMALIQNVSGVRNYQTPIVLDGLKCRGSEANIDQCEHLPVVEYCTHSDDAGADCSVFKECNDTDVRLVQLPGDMENEGRVEYCSGGRWGLVCFDFWDTNDARVICRQLGYDVENRSVAITDRDIGRFTLIALTGVDCIGTENNINKCPKASHRVCLNPGAGVICPYIEPECNDTDVRLQGGELSDEIGRVEACMAGQWGLVCHDNWDDFDAAVVCRQLGYTGGVATSMSTFGRTIGGHFVVDNVNCTGNESNIFDCQYPTGSTPDCRVSNDEEAGVICGVTPGLSERCTTEHINNHTVTLAESATNLTAGSIGTCQPYLKEASRCSTLFNSNAYVFTGMDQSILSKVLNERIFPIFDGRAGECSDLILRLLCHYFFAPCGANGQLHFPLAVCPDECHYVQSTCEGRWRTVNNLLSSSGLSTIGCTSTDALIQGLAPCCIDAGITIQAAATTMAMVTVAHKGVPGSVPVELIIGVLSALLVVLIVVTIGAVGLAAMITKKKKTTIRNLQVDVLSSPTVRTLESTGVSFRKSLDEIDCSGAEIKLRNNDGSKRLQQAVPNPYSNQQELGLSAPLLTPSENKMMNRISSSIIRELSSNMLIPCTRLKLLECVGQGEFGVVYKAQHTEPEGDTGYKTSTVAVKTLKGFFDNSQVNKIMEESIKMKHFDHPNVLHLIGVCLDAGPAPYVVMPYMANGSLLHYLKKERNNLVLPGGVDEDVKLDVRKRLTVMCLQIASGMEYLAGEKFIHRDLAARNCMIDVHFVIKIADFGLSEDIYSKNYFRQSGSDKSVKLPVKWMAPESLSDGVFSEKSDVWSFGVTCWEVFSGGKTPYPGVDPLLLSQMLDNEQRLIKPLNVACPEEMYSLMMKCWEKSPDERPSFADVVSAVSSYTELVAGYIDLSGYNPFESTYTLLGSYTLSGANASSDSDRETKANSASTEQLVQNVESGNDINLEDRDKKKQKALSRSSMCASPQASSPTLKFSASSTPSSTGIQIQTQRPLEGEKNHT